MAYFVTSPGAGWQPIANTETEQKHPLGTIVRGRDPAIGEAEFIYLLGVGSTVVGSVVTYDGVGYLTALGTTVVTGPSMPLAVAMSANVASQYGWYMIAGRSTMSKANSVSFADGAALAISAGKAIASASGNVMQGGLVYAVASAKSDVTTVSVFINRPHGPVDVS